MSADESANEAKRKAAQAALDELPVEGLIGLGSGSTAQLFIDGVGRLVAEGRRYVGVPTSEASRKRAEALRIPLLDDAGPWDIDLTVDGADEVDAQLSLIKGGGACQTREKIVNYASRRNIIVVDASKLSRNLGEKWPVPIEVIPFGHKATERHLSKLGEVRFRHQGDRPVRTDAGNFIFDLNVGIIADPSRLDRELRAVPGVVETGLFVGRADMVIVADEAGARRIHR